MGEVKSLLFMFVTATMLVSTMTACGGASRQRGSASQASPDAVVAKAGAASTAPRFPDFKGDSDDDDERGEIVSTTKSDSDADFDEDSRDAKRGYIDGDDHAVLAFGHTASATDRKALAAIVMRYYTAAGVADGARACSMMTARYVVVVPEDYGRGAGPSYARGKTCATVMSKLFKHLQKQVAVLFKVTDVRVKGSVAIVLLGSALAPASDVSLEQEDGTWKIASLIGTPLP